MKPGATGITRIIHAYGYSKKGLIAAYKNEAAFRQELLLLVIAIPLAIFLGQNKIEIALMIFSVVCVLVVELINSALEAVVDRIGSEHHELSGRAKDIGSAAVLIALMGAGIVWGVILFV